MSGNSRGLMLVLTCAALLLAGCNESTPPAETGVLDTSRLPRVSGSKEIFASPAATYFTSPESVVQTADNLDKALTAAGWQKYTAPNMASSSDPDRRLVSLKKGTQALSVFITIAPAQNNATSVQYAALSLKTDLPFTKDGGNIEYAPERPYLALVTAEPIDKTLDFYRKELGARGWAMWSAKVNGKQTPDGPSGTTHERGAYAHYVTDKDPSIVLVLTVLNADTGKSKVEIKQWPASILADLHKAYLNGGATVAKPVNLSELPRLDGAKLEGAGSPDRLTYSAPGSVPDTVDATRKLLAAAGWKQYVAPLDETHATLLTFKKGSQGLTVHFTMMAGQSGQSSVNYSATRLGFALPFPAEATDVVFDENRPYLNCVTTGTVDANLAFFQKEFVASGWLPLTQADAMAKWPNARIDDKAANGALAYFISENKRPVVLSLQSSGDGKVRVEIRVPSFARAQTLEAGQNIVDLPAPSLRKSGSGARSGNRREMRTNVPADIETVLAFYRRELTARNWKEESDGAVVGSEQVSLTFTSTDGKAALKLAPKYDFTTVSLVQQQVAKPAVKAEPAAGGDSIESMMKQVQQLTRDADALSPPKAAAGSTETLRPLAGNDTPVPLPETATDIEFANGKLEFSSTSNVASVAGFYRSIMKAQGWSSASSVINNPNMVVLNFSKAGKAASFTLMRMGDKTNVSADGSALEVATKPETPGVNKTAAADTPAQPATEDDLIAEESGGLPVPKRRTMAEANQSPFRRELNASVPLALVDVLAFYRRELGRLNWKEESKGTTVVADKALVAYATGTGPALLTLTRKDAETSIKLAVKDPDAATKAGVIPKPGQAKVLVTNPTDVELTIDINKQTYKVAAGGGTKGPDGAMIDLPPGKYKFSTKLSGKPAREDTLEVEADQSWALLVAPNGALPMLVY